MKNLVVKVVAITYRSRQMHRFRCAWANRFCPRFACKRTKTTSQEELMKYNKWTLGLAAAGVVSLASAALAEEAQKQMSQVLTAVASTTLSGYVDTSMIWKPGTGNANLPGRAFDGVGKVDGFNFNVAEIQLEKALSEEQWAAGYRVQLLVGPDANHYNTSPFGGGPTSSDFSLKDAYIALRVPVANGIDFKV